MSEAAARALELFQADVGNDEGIGEWFEVDQDQINQFADVTHDHQFIHVDPERAAATPFGTTIAHGFLTLSMLTHLAAGASAAPPDPAKYEGVLMGINYGFNKVRFVSPVKVGSRIRARAVTSNAELKGNMVEVTRNFTDRDRRRGEAGARRRVAHPHRVRLRLGARSYGGASAAGSGTGSTDVGNPSTLRSAGNSAHQIAATASVATPPMTIAVAGPSS